jgi:hypothetical protein
VWLYTFDDGEKIVAFFIFPFGVVTCVFNLSVGKFVAVRFKKETGLINTPRYWC